MQIIYTYLDKYIPLMIPICFYIVLCLQNIYGVIYSFLVPIFINIPKICMYKTHYLQESFYLRKMPVFCKSCQRFWVPTFVFHDPKVLSSIIGLVFFFINSSGQVTYLITAHLSFSLRLDHSFYSRLVGTLVSNNNRLSLLPTMNFKCNF